MSYLLDTNVCVAFLNEREAALKKKLEHTSPDELKLCSVVKAELLFGARHSARVEANLSRLDRFFAAFESIPFDDDAAPEYAVVRAQLKRAGTPIGGNDMMIAGIALAHDLILVTRNQDEFLRIAGLRVESW